MTLMQTRVMETSELPSLKTADPLRELVERAEEQGHLTVDDLLELFPEAEIDLSRVQRVMAVLEQKGIDVILPDERALLTILQAKDYEEESEDEEAAPDVSEVDSHDSVGMYFRQMAEVPLLSREEEQQLARVIDRGRLAEHRLKEEGLVPKVRRSYQQDVQAGQDARTHMIRANTRLVVSIAKRYAGMGVPLLDLIQEGNLGLMRAIDKFDHRRGCKLSTYATWWIRQSVGRALNQQGRVIRLPCHVGGKVRQIYQTAAQIEQDTGKRPSCEEIGDRLQLSPTRVRWLMRVAQRTLSLQKPVGEEGDEELQDLLEDQDSPVAMDCAADALLAEEMERVLATLTPRQARILRLRYGLRGEHPHTLKEVAVKYALTRERIRQIEKLALRRLRHPSRSRPLRAYLN